MDIVNSIVGAACDILLWPFRHLAPIWGLVFLSVVSGIVLLLLYGKISNQAGLKAVKRSIFSFVLESVLYRHDLRLCLRAQGRMFLAACRYFAYAVPPILILAVPCILVLAQLNARYDQRGLTVGEEALISLRLASGQPLRDVQIDVPPQVQVSTPVRSIEEHEVTWRMKLTSPLSGDPKVRLSVPGRESLERPIYSNNSHDQAGMFQGAFESTSPWWTVLYPRWSGFRKIGWIDEFSVAYPAVDYALLGLPMHWIIVFLLVSIVSGLIGSKIFGVEI